LAVGQAPWLGRVHGRRDRAADAGDSQHIGENVHGHDDSQNAKQIDDAS
jgi:hypothetical protein